MRPSPVSLSVTTEDKTFTYFPELPAELRLKIWTATLPGQSVLEIRGLYAGDEGELYSL